VLEVDQNDSVGSLYVLISVQSEGVSSMAFKDLLLTVATYSEPTSVSAIDTSVAFAAAAGAKISALAFEIEFRMPWSPFHKAFPEIPALATSEEKKSRANAESLLAAFQDGAKKARVFQETLVERCQISEVPEVLVGHARLRDLTIVPLPEGDQLQHWYAESIIFGSGRPVLVVPHASKRGTVFELGRVVVAWDFSQPASRAAADALPILQKAKRVEVVTVTNDKVIPSKRSAADLAKNLAYHGVDVSIETEDAAGRRIGDVLGAYVDVHKTDLLVMGAYGHSRVREFVLGGATKSMLSCPPIPILLSH
jgi:nucleotide-binding universal stress UspA family protein